jgi:hypothetical protein
MMDPGGPSPTPDARYEPRAAMTAAHAPMVILGALLVIALALGVITGAINAKTFHQPIPSPSDPITVP